MTQTYLDLQVAPHQERPQDARSRTALETAAAHLEHAAQRLSHTAPDYREALPHSLEAIRQAYTALLEWHTFPPRAGASLAELSHPAEQLVSMLRIYQHRALPLETLEASLRNGRRITVEVREAVELSYYVARDTLSVVLGSLPEQITEAAIRSLNRAQAIRVGRLRLVPDGQRSTASEAPEKPFRPQPVAVA